jgi:glycosyltransferase domain-containing protein
VKSNKKITLLIVTFNRNYCIDRLLKYYVSRDFNQNIIVADASDNDSLLKNKLTYKSVERNLALNVKFLKGYSVIECLDIILEEVDTPYAILNPDDDFLIPSSLNKMTEFLDDNPTYSGVNGNALLQVEENVGNSKRIIKGFGKYEMRSIYGKDRVDRANSLFKNYFGVLFSIFRTEVLISAYRSVPGDSIFSKELIPAYRAASIGNIGHINLLYLVRSAHENRVYVPDLYEQMLDSSWSDNIKLFRDDFNKFTQVNNEISNQSLTVEKILGIYFYNSNREKHRLINFCQRSVNVLKEILSFTEKYMIKGYKNPFYTGSKELVFVVDSVEGKGLDTK